MTGDFFRLRRKLNLMPADVKQRLLELSLWDAYEQRPAYQQNDYLGWIARARRPETRQKYLEQMLEELTAGDSYMRMRWLPSR